MRLIDADALKKAIMFKDNANAETWEQLYDSVLEEIDNAPTVEIPTELCKGCRFLKDCETCEDKLRPQGEWLDIYATHIAYECSNCHIQMPITDYFNFCPNCGTDMRGGAE